MALVEGLKKLKKLWDWVPGILFEFMLFILWLLLFLLWPRKPNKSGYYTLRHILDTFDCFRCPIHCPDVPQESAKLTEQKQALPKSSSHPTNLPVPPLRSRTKKPTKLQIVRQELQKELNKPSNKVNIKRVNELYKKVDELEERWRKRSEVQKRIWIQRKQPSSKKALKGSIRTSPRCSVSKGKGTSEGYPTYPSKPLRGTVKSSESQRPAIPSSSGLKKQSKSSAKLSPRSRKLTRLQIIRCELDKELSRLSESVNIDRVKELERKKERLEQEWHNRSRAQKQAWRWRKKINEIVKEKAIKNTVQSAGTSGQFESTAMDKKTCARCPVHCPPVKSICGHWKNRLHDLLSSILSQIDAQNRSKDPRDVSIGHIFKHKNSEKAGLIISFVQEIARQIYQK